MREAKPAAISTKAITSATITRARLLMASVLDGCSRFGTVHRPIANESVWGCNAAGEAYFRESSLTGLAATSGNGEPEPTAEGSLRQCYKARHGERRLERP